LTKNRGEIIFISLKHRSPKAAKTDCRRRGAITYMKTNKHIRKCSLSKNEKDEAA
jgi:hypothetical protein